MGWEFGHRWVCSSPARLEIFSLKMNVWRRWGNAYSLLLKEIFLLRRVWEQKVSSSRLWGLMWTFCWWVVRRLLGRWFSEVRETWWGWLLRALANKGNLRNVQEAAGQPKCVRSNESSRWDVSHHWFWEANEWAYIFTIGRMAWGTSLQTASEAQE